MKEFTELFMLSRSLVDIAGQLLSAIMRAATDYNCLMPIRPELRKYYGAEWRRYRETLLVLAGHRCTRCGMGHTHLNAAHVHHDPRNGQLITILCPACHARHDTPQRIAMTRRTRAKRSGQLWLTPEIEYAPYASWMVPRRVLEEAQLGLFGNL